MKQRTLIMHRSYFGIEALRLREGSARAASRIVGLPAERARVNVQNLWHDFGVNPVAGKALIEEFVAQGMLQPREGKPDDFFLTELFLEIASARVVEPLPRDKAHQLLAKGRDLANEINVGWSHNPFEIEAVAAYGSYMGQDPHLSELNVGIVVCARLPAHRSRWRRMTSKIDGLHAIRASFRDLSSFVRVHMVKERPLLPRPFTIVFPQA